MSNRTLVHETANAPGTNVTFTLAGPVAARRSFAMAFVSGAPAFYVMTDGVQSECGQGTFTAGAPNTLARTTVYGNSANTTARLNFTGVVDVYNALPGEMASYLGSDWGGTSGGTANALTVTLPLAPAFRVPGRTIRCLIATTNTGAAQLNENGLGLTSIRKGISGSDALVAGDLIAGRIAEFLWDGTYYRLLSPAIPTVVSITAVTGAGVQLPVGPAGSYWEYILFQYNGSGAFSGGFLTGVDVAGTVLNAGTGGLQWVGTAKRVA
jgi:hypothetical protein